MSSGLIPPPLTHLLEMERFDPETIISGSRLRPLNEKKLTALKVSIGEIGLQTPLTVWIEADGSNKHSIHLVCGFHRLEAVKQLGWDGIDCYVTTAGELERFQ